MHEQNALLNYNDLAKMLKRSSNTLRVDVMKRRIPFIKIGRAVRFDLEQIQNFIKSNSIPTGK